MKKKITKMNPIHQSQEGVEIKRIIDLNEQQSLLFDTEALLQKTKIDRELEEFTLINGLPFTIKGVKDLVTEMAGEYLPMFPNSKPFFKLMYKLLGWTHLNPNAFIKPPCVALYIKQYIYARFDAEVLPTLMAKENPIIKGYIRKYKLFQFLNSEGLVLLEQYIQQAIEIMEHEDTKDWYDFEVKYGTLYNLTFQLKLSIR